LTQNYVVGAISGTATIAAAVVAFVMLVSLNTLQDWPISGLGLPFGNGDSGGAAREHEPRSPAPNRTAAVAPGASLGATQAPEGAADAARHGQAGVGGGNAIAGSRTGSGDIATGTPTASPPSSGSAPPSDAGSAAPVESTGAGSGSGFGGGAGVESGPVSRSAPGVDEAPPQEGIIPPLVATPPPADCGDADSDNADAISEEAVSEDAVAEEAASEEAMSEEAASEEAGCDGEGSAGEAGCDEALLDGVVSEEGACEQRDPDSNGAPAGPIGAFLTQRG
jgi:hypothetical protein